MKGLVEGTHRRQCVTRMTALSLALVGSLTVLTFAQDAPFPEATFILHQGDAPVTPGDTASVPMRVNATLELQGLSVSLNFDEGVLEAVEVAPVFEVAGLDQWYFLVFNFDSTDDTPGESGFDEGWLWAAGLFGAGESEDYWESIPQRNQDNHIFDFSFRVRDDAPLGTTDLVFADGAPTANPDVPVDNVAVLEGQDVPLQFDVTPFFVSGELLIAEAISHFLRGDSDSNGMIEINDAIFTLRYLFLGTAVPDCLAAADANADGFVNVVDAVLTLRYLVLGTEELPSSGNEEGC